MIDKARDNDVDVVTRNYVEGIAEEIKNFGNVSNCVVREIVAAVP